MCPGHRAALSVGNLGEGHNKHTTIHTTNAYRLVSLSHEPEGRNQDKSDWMDPTVDNIGQDRMSGNCVLQLLPLYPILYALATKIARVYHISKQLKICGLWGCPCRGQQSLFLKFLTLPDLKLILNMHPKAMKGWLLLSLRATIIVALNEHDNICGLAKEIDLMKDLHSLAFFKLPGKLGRQLPRQWDPIKSVAICV